MADSRLHPNISARPVGTNTTSPLDHAVGCIRVSGVFGPRNTKWRVTRNELIATFAGIIAIIASWVVLDATVGGSTDEFAIPPLAQYADPYPYDSLVDGLYISLLRGETRPSDVASCDDLAHVYGRRTADVRRYWYFEFRDGVPLDSSRFNDASAEAFWRAGDDDLARAIGDELNSRCGDIGT